MEKKARALVNEPGLNSRTMFSVLYVILKLRESATKKHTSVQQESEFVRDQEDRDKWAANLANAP